MSRELGDYEPIGAREGLVIRALADLFDGSHVPRINNREETRGEGRALSAEMVGRLTLIEALDRLSARARHVLYLRFGEREEAKGAARRLGTDLNAVLTCEHDALEMLVRLLWDEPAYTSGARLRRSREVREAVAAAVRGRLALK